MAQSQSEQIRQVLLPYKAQVKRRAKGALKYDYLVPAGPYEEQWDWDAFFVGMSLLTDIPSESIFLRNWALNYLALTNPKTGFTPGLVTPKGRDKRLNHIKPFLAQGCYFASKNFGDFEWLRPYLGRLQKAISYREKHLWSKEYGLGMWFDGMESGADNNLALLPFPKGTIIGADLNAFMYREYKAVALIARELGQKAVEKKFLKKAADLKRNINRYLWDKKDQSYYNLDTRTGELVKRDTYSNLVPLWAGLAPQAAGRAMIRRVVLNPRKLWAPHGVRTLAKDDRDYNNANIIKPHSNWQGPVWPIANYLSMHALLNYGFQKEARILADRIVAIVLRDIRKTGGMHECYHAETGSALAAPNFVSWNLLVAQMPEQAKTKINPFAL